MLVSKFQQAFYPFQNLSVDEMVIGWKGKWKYKQYNAFKPKKYHIKTFGLCDSATGYVFNILTYFGNETSYMPNQDESSGQAEKVFQYLLQGLDQGHHVFADRYYTTYKLVQYLSQHKTYYTGTLNTNRKNFPPQIKTLKLAHCQQKAYRNRAGDIFVAAWRDKKAKKPVVITGGPEKKSQMFFLNFFYSAATYFSSFILKIISMKNSAIWHVSLIEGTFHHFVIISTIF